MTRTILIACVFLISTDAWRIRRGSMSEGPAGLGGLADALSGAASGPADSTSPSGPPPSEDRVSEVNVPDKVGNAADAARTPTVASNLPDINSILMQQTAGNLAVPTTLQVVNQQQSAASQFMSRGPGRYMMMTFQQVPTIQQAPIVGIPLSTIQRYYNPHMGDGFMASTTPAPIPSFEATAYYPLVWRFPFSNVQLPAYTTTGQFAYTAYPVKYYGSLPSQVSEKIAEAQP